MGPEEEEASEPFVNANSFELEELEQPVIAGKLSLKLSLITKPTPKATVNTASHALMKFDDEAINVVNNNIFSDKAKPKDCAEFGLPTATEHPPIERRENARTVGNKQNYLRQKDNLYLHVENRIDYNLESGAAIEYSKDIREEKVKSTSILKDEAFIEDKCGKRKGLKKKKRWLQGTFLCNFQHVDSYKVEPAAEPAAEPESDQVDRIDTTSEMKRDTDNDITTGHTCRTPVENDSECNKLTANSHHEQKTCNTGDTTADKCSENDNYCDYWWEEFDVPDEDFDTYSKIETNSSSQMVLNFELSNARPGFGTASCKIFRHKTKWKKQKARQQTKAKYLKDIQHARGKHLYISHRVVKIIDLPIREPNTSSTRTTVAGSVKCTLPSKPVSSVKVSAPRKLHNQGPLLALDTNTASDDLKQALEAEGHASARLALLIELQHRDITPEDYDLLLVLDAQIAASTASAGVVSSLQSRVVTEDELHQLPADTCAVCLSEFAEGDEVSPLQCGHYFHTPCIKRWLENASPNCPLDGVPVESS